MFLQLLYRVEAGNYYRSKLERETAMNKSKILIVPIAVLAGMIFSSTFDARADDQQAISDLEHKYATITTGDEVMKYWDSGDDIVLFDAMVPPREYAGHKTIHDHVDEFSGWTNPKVYFLELKVISDGNLALARSVQHFTATADYLVFILSEVESCDGPRRLRRISTNASGICEIRNFRFSVVCIIDMFDFRF